MTLLILFSRSIIDRLFEMYNSSCSINCFDTIVFNFRIKPLCHNIEHSPKMADLFYLFKAFPIISVIPYFLNMFLKIDINLTTKTYLTQLVDLHILMQVYISKELIHTIKPKKNLVSF